MSDKPYMASTEELEDSEQEVCPFCGEELPGPEPNELQEFNEDGLEVCPSCGEIL